MFFRSVLDEQTPARACNQREAREVSKHELQRFALLRSVEIKSQVYNQHANRKRVVAVNQLQRASIPPQNANHAAITHVHKSNGFVACSIRKIATA